MDHEGLRPRGAERRPAAHPPDDFLTDGLGRHRMGPSAGLSGWGSCSCWSAQWAARAASRLLRSPWMRSMAGSKSLAHSLIRPAGVRRPDVTEARIQWHRSRHQRRRLHCALAARRRRDAGRVVRPGTRQRAILPAKPEQGRPSAAAGPAYRLGSLQPGPESSAADHPGPHLLERLQGRLIDLGPRWPWQTKA